MGRKYMLDAFNYPYPGYSSHVKQTNWLFIAVIYFIVYSIKYDGVNIQKRGVMKK